MTNIVNKTREKMRKITILVQLWLSYAIELQVRQVASSLQVCGPRSIAGRHNE
jgi:hypothetical protein